MNTRPVSASTRNPAAATDCPASPVLASFQPVIEYLQHTRAHVQRPFVRDYPAEPVKGKGSPYPTTEHRVPELIPVLGSQPEGDVSHKPGGRLPLLSARPAVTPATLKRSVTNFAAWRTEARWV